MSGFRNLAVYSRAATLADLLHEHVDTWPSLDQWTVGVQMIRSADSIGANIAEGYGRATDQDRRRFLVMARGSALELQHWIDRASARRLALPTDAVRDAAKIGRMLNGLLRASDPTTNDQRPTTRVARTSAP